MNEFQLNRLNFTYKPAFVLARAVQPHREESAIPKCCIGQVAINYSPGIGQNKSSNR